MTGLSFSDRSTETINGLSYICTYINMLFLWGKHRRWNGLNTIFYQEILTRLSWVLYIFKRIKNQQNCLLIVVILINSVIFWNEVDSCERWRKNWNTYVITEIGFQCRKLLTEKGSNKLCQIIPSIFIVVCGRKKGGTNFSNFFLGGCLCKNSENSQVSPNSSPSFSSRRVEKTSSF